jgi:uncharacterized protein
MSFDGLVSYITSFIVEKPEQVSVREVSGDTESIIELRVAPEDIGKVIGKSGRIAKSIRTVVTAAATKKNINYTLEIID